MGVSAAALLALRLLAPAQGQIFGALPQLPAGETVRVDDLVAALREIADAQRDDPDVQADWAALVERHGLRDDDDARREYARVRLLFESTRDGGLWNLHWDITNRAPNSDAIWAQWRAHDDYDGRVASATAECDELSALFAHLAHRMGVRHVGLLWPVWNHVVAVWTVPGEHGDVRIVVPTSQIMLDDEQTLGTTEFDPMRQRRIYDYRRRDAADGLRLPRALAADFVLRSWYDGGRPAATLQRDRTARSARL
ncbi:MAG: hypothetical protein IPH07_16235 [Deltaproteobacteria bacterium]|nr:hypothetical protein [Deltaproteobacteria bacterium]MBK8719599.1 hypothetical protein [Deltaproteobacteria bacterium]MBP7290889.1 hypothetical protein [Nannocystaceae bacterium]